MLKQRELADESGETDKVNHIDMELEELENQAERLDRRRTVGFKSINSINQRNRILSVKHAEEAIMKDSQEAANSREEDPFTRIQSKPVIVTKSYLERRRNKKVSGLWFFFLVFYYDIGGRTFACHVPYMRFPVPAPIAYVLGCGRRIGDYQWTECRLNLHMGTANFFNLVVIYWPYNRK